MTMVMSHSPTPLATLFGAFQTRSAAPTHNEANEKGSGGRENAGGIGVGVVITGTYKYEKENESCIGNKCVKRFP